MRSSPLRADCFLIEVDGISSAGFASCHGLRAERDVLVYREGGLDGARCFQGALRPGRLVLERGLARDRGLWEWHASGLRRDGAVVQLDADAQEVMRWSFVAGWPCVWEGPPYDAEAARVALERVEIVHEGLRWPSA